MIFLNLPVQIMKNVFVVFILLLLLFSACKEKELTSVNNETTQRKILDEVKIREIKLTGPASERITEISGLTWYKDNLIILPQFPNKFTFGNGGTLYTIPKSEIGNYLSGSSNQAIEPGKIEFIANGLEKYNNKDSGYESIVFLGDNAYLTIEYVNNGNTESLIVSGIIDWKQKRLTLNPESVKQSPAPQYFFNWSTETVLTYNNYIFTIFEVNGKNLIDNPKAYKFTSSLDFISTVPFPAIEYRVTDATVPDSNGNFWVINYLYPGDRQALKPAGDFLISKYGIGRTHIESDAVERLVELKFDNGSIKFADRAPVYLQLPPGEPSRNWEGIAKFDNRGFIIATDKHPETILAFVPVNNL